jgi:hypothetical protein
MEVNVLPTETQALIGATHEAVITHEDLTASATTQILSGINIPVGSWVKGGPHILEQDFDSPDSSSLTYSAGDGTDADLFMTATEIDVAATEVDYKAPTPGSGYVGPLADTLDIAFTSSGDNLSDFTQGKLRYYFSLVDLDTLK